MKKSLIIAWLQSPNGTDSWYDPIFSLDTYRNIIGVIPYDKDLLTKIWPLNGFAFEKETERIMLTIVSYDEAGYGYEHWIGPEMELKDELNTGNITPDISSALDKRFVKNHYSGYYSKASEHERYVKILKYFVNADEEKLKYDVIPGFFGTLTVLKLYFNINSKVADFNQARLYNY